MNRLAVSISILSVMAAGCTAAAYVTEKMTEKMSSCIELVEESFRRGDYDRSTDYAEQLGDIWDSILDHSILLSDLGHAVEITTSVAEMISFAEEENDEIYAACDRAEALIKLLRDNQIPTLWKIL